MSARAAGPPPDASVVVTTADYRDETRLAALLWDRATDVIEAREQVGTAASEVTRARLFPNPTLDAGWNTIPVGRTTPSNLGEPLANVPNYTAGLSELLDPAKRGPRQDAALAELASSRARATAVLADRFFDLLHAVGRIATSQVRVALIDEQVADRARLLELERARADKGEVAQMLVDRSETEQLRLLASRDAARTELEAARAECAALLASTCPPFESGESARQFLRDGASLSLPRTWSPEIETRRPDLAALADAAHAAEARTTLARRAVVPDVTVRLGYTYDQFVVAGNQRQSLGVGVQVPLPLSDRGQADLQAAAATALRVRRARAALVGAGQAALDAAVRQRALIGDRVTQIETSLHKVDTLRNAMEGAVQRGGMSQVDVLLARRTQQELLLDGAELDGDAFDVALKIRQLAGLFPTPSGGTERAS